MKSAPMILFFLASLCTLSFNAIGMEGQGPEEEERLLQDRENEVTKADKQKGKKRKRTPGKVTYGTACKPCRMAHKKCDDKRPCSTCIDLGRESKCEDQHLKKKMGAEKLEIFEEIVDLSDPQDMALEDPRLETYIPRTDSESQYAQEDIDELRRLILLMENPLSPNPQ